MSTAHGYGIAISNDGPGIPAIKLESLAAGTETPLQHGCGLGLWQLRWGVDALGRNLSFEVDDGTIFNITLVDLKDGAEM